VASILADGETQSWQPEYSEAIKMIGYVYEVAGNYNGAIEQWVNNEQVLGYEQRAKELRLVFEKAGYHGYLRKDAKDKEVEGDYYDAAGTCTSRQFRR
jgi:hypothetical protein